jgi:hypothetical protein
MIALKLIILMIMCTGFVKVASVIPNITGLVLCIVVVYLFFRMALDDGG